MKLIYVNYLAYLLDRILQIIFSEKEIPLELIRSERLLLLSELFSDSA